MRRIGAAVVLAYFLVAVNGAALAQSSGEKSAGDPPAASEETVALDPRVIPVDAKIFIAAMPDAFDVNLKAAIEEKRVPVRLVASRDEADFEITGISESYKSRATKFMLTQGWRSGESASIKAENLKTGVIVFAYAYFAPNTPRGKRTSAESCAKHLMEKIGSGK